MINYAIPGLYIHYKLNLKLLKLMEINPEYFYPNINIEAAYGTFPFCIFDGGRIFENNYHASLEEIENIIKNYQSFNVSSRLVYTNSQLTEKNFLNRFGNLCLSLCNDYQNNQVVVADNNFLEYIKEKYSNLNFISSTTKCLKSDDFYKELHNSNFLEICLDYNLNHNFSLLTSLTQEEKEKCEFLCNAICPPGCPTRKQHYKLNSLYNLSFGKDYAVPYCKINDNTLSPEQMQFCNTITYQEIKEKYEPLGFCHFKLEGRTFSKTTQALIYAEYMVKPEYKNLVIQYLLS